MCAYVFADVAVFLMPSNLSAIHRLSQQVAAADGFAARCSVDVKPSPHSAPCRQAGLTLFECSEFRQFPRGGAVLGAAKISGGVNPKKYMPFQSLVGVFIA